MVARKAKRILIIDGHPDAGPDRLPHALAAAYQRGAVDGGHETRLERVAELEFELLRTADELNGGRPTGRLREQQDAQQWAEHVVILFALLKDYFRQVFRPGFAFGPARNILSCVG